MTLRAAPALLLAPLLLTATPIAAQQAQDLSFDTAILEGLDKITAHTFTLVAPVGESVHYGRLDVMVRACRKHRPEENPETAAFLDVWERRTNQPTLSLFRGWMFASSPAVSAMEHPVYDLWVMDCVNAADLQKAKDNPQTPAAPKPPPELLMTDD